MLGFPVFHVEPPPFPVLNQNRGDGGREAPNAPGHLFEKPLEYAIVEGNISGGFTRKDREVHYGNSF